VVLVGRSIAGELAELRQFGFALAIAGVAVLAAALAIGAWLAGRAMRPLHRIGASARRIAAGSHSDRIDTAGLPEELATLAGVLNEGFAQIEETLVRQRQFTADASHELRTPVSVILAQSQAALARPRSEAEYRQSLEACQRAAQRMRRLVESLLTLTRLESGEEPLRRQAVDLNELAREAVEAVRPLAHESRIQLRFEPAAASITIHADPDKMGQVVLNLLGNAIAYNRPEGEVAVATGILGTEAFLRVRDTGIGIATEHLAKIFDRFYRVDPSRTNTRGHSGLGLAISARIMAQHGGRITVESEPGRGSIFTVWLTTASGGYLEPTPLAQANSPDSTVQSCPK
jgi:heavy metal sensor kinase